MRLGNLERDVGLLPDTIEGGGIANVAPTGKTYVMRPGDTLWSVASKHGTSINSLRSANHLTDDHVGIGETLLIPTGEITFDSPATPSRRQHIVKSGETFTKIASEYGISVHALAKANPSAYADKLLIGERLTIPGGNGSSSGGSTRTVTMTSGTHTVKKGEHLGSIAKKYGISTASLAAANRLKNANIVVIGQRLSIPGVKTTRSVPQNLAVADPETVPLHDMRLTDPAPLVKPEPPTPPSMPLPPITPSIVPTTPQTPRGVVAYRMERGDTLETVANMFSTTPENIRALNKLPASKQVKEGEEIIVPSLGAVSVN
jgi:LysM repeat protein